MVNFRITPLAPRLTQIEAVCHERIYVVEGSVSCAVIDSGSGFGSLLQAVRQITPKPVLLLLTHGHVDHAMGATEFDTVYMNPIDIPMYRQHSQKPWRMAMLRSSRNSAGVTEADMLPPDDPERFLPIREGDIIDLGGATLEAFACPGHTRGSMVFLHREEGVLFTGDAVSNFSFLLEDTAPTVQQYRDNLRSLDRKTAGRCKRILEAHGRGDLPLDIMESVAQVCDDVLGGNSDEIPYEFQYYKGFLAKAMTGLTRTDGKHGNLLYRKENIRQQTP